MKIRDVNVIQKEIDDVDKILVKINRLLSKDPDDLSLELDLETFQCRKNQLTQEMAHAYDKKNISPRKIGIIKDELSDVQESILFNNNLLKEFPDDETLKFNLEDLYLKENQLFDELIRNYSNRGANIKQLNIFGEVGRGEILMKKLGGLLSSTQSLITATSLDKSVKENATIRPNLEINTNMMFAGMSGGSVKILLKKEQDTLIKDEEDVLDKSFDKFKNIIECGNDKDSINEIFKDMSEKVIITYRDFLSVLDENKIGIEFEDPLKKENKKMFDISSKKAGLIHEIITAKEEDTKHERINGVIRAIDVDLKEKRFKIRPNGKKKSIEIFFDDDRVDEVSENKVNSTVTIDIKDNITKKQFSNRIKHKRKLKRFIKKSS